MKKVFLLLLVCFAINTAEAQLLKKLKEKAQKALDPSAKKPESSQQETTTEEQAPAQNKSAAKWQPTADCEKLFLLQPGESFFYDETKVVAINGKMSYAFVIQNKNHEYFLIEDGKRSGPFREAPVAQMNIVSDKKYTNEDSGGSDNDDDNIKLGNDEKDPVTAQYSKTINSKLYIVFNGKNYGPYDFIAKIKLSPDKKKFWAAVVTGGQNDMLSKMGMGTYALINESGVVQKATGQNSFATKLIVSQNFTAAALSVMDNTSQKAFVMSSTGKKQESSAADVYSGARSSISVAENGDIISVLSQSPTQLLVNGNEAAAFKVPITNMSRLFILPDYKKSVYYQSGKIYHGDGTEEPLTGITFPKFVLMNNQPIIYYYKIYQNDTGDKEVYLCKKVM